MKNEDEDFDEEYVDEDANILSEDDYDSEEQGEEIMSTNDAEDQSGLSITFGPYAMRDMAATVSERLALKLEPTIKKIVEAKLDEVLNEAWHAKVGEMAQAAIDSYLTKPRAKTNSYGEQTGESTMLSAKIPETVTKWLNQPVDREGREQSDSYSRNYPSRIDWLLQKMVTEQLANEIKKSVDGVTEKARQLVAGQVGRFVSEQMVPSIELKN